jgi:caspase domain-containing protein
MSASSFSLHIGINAVDKNHYKGWDGKLQGCENDALFYHELAKKEGCKFSKLLLTSDSGSAPTSANVLGFLDYSISELHTGDNLIITYSGHGGIMEDKNYDEPDFQDETWCLYDRQLLDDELLARFSRFQPGVNIFVISDSCHSGSVVKGIADNVEADSRLKRFVPRQQLFETYQANREVYDPLMRMAIIRDEDIPAAVLQLGACQDDEFAMEDGGNGLFTKTIMKILEKNGDIGSYQELFIRSKRALHGIQRPNLLSYGKNHELLIRSKPFGSSFNPATPLRNDLFNDNGDFTVEVKGLHEELKDLKQFIVSQSSSLTEGVEYITYRCSCKFEEPGMYAWDHAYQQYQMLRKNGYPVRCVMPASPEAGATTDTQAVVDERIDTFHKRFKGKLRNSRGVGKVAAPEEDDVLIRMFCIETLQVISKDEDLLLYRNLTNIDLDLHLEDPTKYNTFATILKSSIFSSDTLTVHL